MVIVISGCVALSGCLFGYDESRRTTAHVDVGAEHFDPSLITVYQGDIIVWHNKDTLPHQVVSDHGNFSSGYIQPGDAWQFQFEETGDFSYHCPDHSRLAEDHWMGMTGRVKVKHLPE